MHPLDGFLSFALLAFACASLVAPAVSALNPRREKIPVFAKRADKNRDCAQ